MKLLTCLFLASALGVAAAVAAARSETGDVFLACDGKAEAVIVIPEAPPIPVRFAAEELGAYLAQVCGGEFPVAHAIPSNGAAIVLGEAMGGAIYAEWSTVTLNGNTILSNTAASSGGGVAIGQHNMATLSGNLVRGNTAADYGGGVWIGAPTAVTLSGNAILSNTASVAGGAMTINEGATVNARNDVVADNTSPFEAIHLAGGTLTAHHWTLANNGSHALTTSGGSATLTNTIVASHTVAGFWGTGITTDHTLFFDNGTPCGGGASCSNNLSGDPRFLNPSAGDYHIGPASAALDRGVDAGIYSDMDNQPRPYQAPDLGADEYWPPDVLKYAYLPLAFGN